MCVFGDYDADGVTAAALVTDVLRALGAEVVPAPREPLRRRVRALGPALARVLDDGRDAPRHVRLRLERPRAPRARPRRAGHRRRRHRPPPRAGRCRCPRSRSSTPTAPSAASRYKGLASVGLALSIAAGVRAALGVRARPAPLARPRRHRHDRRRRAARRRQPAARPRRPRRSSRAADAPGHARARRDRRLRDGHPDGRGRLVPLRPAHQRARPPRQAGPRARAPARDERRRGAAHRRRGRGALHAAQGGRARRRSPRRSRCSRTRRSPRCRASSSRSRGGIPASSASWPGRLAVALRQAHRRRRARRRRRAAARRAGPAGFSVYDALARSRDALVGFGGHHAAAGVEVAADRVDAFRDRFAEACSALGVPARSRALRRRRPSSSRATTPRASIHDLLASSRAARRTPPRASAIDGAQRPRRARAARRPPAPLGRGRAARRSPASAPRWARSRPRSASSARLVGALRRDTWPGGGAVEMRLLAAEPA